MGIVAVGGASIPFGNNHIVLTGIAHLHGVLNIGENAVFRICLDLCSVYLFSLIESGFCFLWALQGEIQLCTAICNISCSRISQTERNIVDLERDGLCSLIACRILCKSSKSMLALAKLVCGSCIGCFDFFPIQSYREFLQCICFCNLWIQRDVLSEHASILNAHSDFRSGIVHYKRNLCCVCPIRYPKRMLSF